MSANPPRLTLFSRIGVELEYMIVDAHTLSVRPLADELIRAALGNIQSEVDRGDLAWSNELALHVIELKTNGPARSLSGLAEKFHREILEMQRLLQPSGARLMPTAMHPWMNPLLETRLWPHEYSPVYEAYHRIFGCQGHGWSNLQSMHLNLPFSNDPEFARLHAAIRVILAILPALAASSPITDGKRADWLDNRLAVYRMNSARIPSITGRVIPEAVFTPAEYERDILQPMFRDIAPFDENAILQDEFLNSRGAIARFSRGSIEIRVIDLQECPAADIAVAALALETLRNLAEERWSNLKMQMECETERLESIFLSAAQYGDETIISDPRFLRIFGCNPQEPLSARRLWCHLAASSSSEALREPAAGRALNVILNHGTLARRIVRAAQGDFSIGKLREVYGRLCHCLQENLPFVG